MHQELMAFEDTPIEEVKFASIPIVSSYKISTLLSEFQKVNKNRRQVVNYNILEEEQKDVLMLLKNDKVDFAFVRDGFDQLPEYEHRLFMTDEIGLICSQESELAQLQEFDFSMLRIGMCFRWWPIMLVLPFLQNGCWRKDTALKG